MSLDTDIAIIGAGPSGLCFARAIAHTGLRVTLVDKQDRDNLAKPADDGREIAITHHSRKRMQALGLWSRIKDQHKATLRDAKVLDGNHGPTLLFRHQEARRDQLGWLVSNHAIRRAAWDAVDELDNVECRTGIGVQSVQRNTTHAELQLDNEETLHAQLVVAADSRFSRTRRAMGIGAHMHDFGKTMLVLRMQHDDPHQQTAWEWFDKGQTLALLPLHDPHTSSLVLTLPPDEMDALLAQNDEALGQDISRRFRHRLGSMQVAGPRCAYPLVGTYAHRFVSQRLALIGDAAVGMHPVTAHGFNFGLQSAHTLAEELAAAVAGGKQLDDPATLARYQRRHRIASFPLYRATQLIAELYSNDRPHARVLRKAALSAGAHIGPFRRMVMSGLTAEEGSLPRPLRMMWQRRAA